MSANYNKIYYETKYKGIISQKTYYCECCQKMFKLWNAYKHKKSAKHIFNSLPDDEKQKVLNARLCLKLTKYKEKLEQQIF